MKMRRFGTTLMAVAMALQLFGASAVTYAAGGSSVVINEVSWAGSADNSSDEWIELYNSGNESVDLSGWVIEDDGTTSYEIVSGSIGPHDYFLIEDVEVATSVASDAVIPLSFANAGDSLVLKDAEGQTVDEVNVNGGAWPAGGGDEKATMERVDPAVDGGVSDNWATAVSSGVATGRDGGVIFGTPKMANSNFGGSGPQVLMSAGSGVVEPGAQLNLAIEVKNVTDLYAYGLEVVYDPEVLTFVSADEGLFLDAGATETAFDAALENGVEGKIVIGAARLKNPPIGVDGEGTLVNLIFAVNGEASGATDISFSGSSFLSDRNGGIPAVFQGVTLQVQASEIATVGDPQIDLGTERFSLTLNWTGTSETYEVSRLQPNGSYLLLGEVTETTFVDDYEIIPGVEYKYLIVPKNAGIAGDASEVSAIEDRGLIGDLDRSDRVDGRDLEALARAYGSEFGDEEYSLLVDSNFDGVIDGSDLINVGMNFGMTY